MSDHPNSIVIKLILDGDFRAAAAVAKEHGLPIFRELSRTADFLSLTTWLAGRSEQPDIRLVAQAVLQAVAAISPRWVEQANPRPPTAALMPGTRAAFDRLILQVLGDRGYYHPIRLPGTDGLIPPNRENAPASSSAFHEAEWELVRPLLIQACGGSLADKVVVDAGCADGFFTLNLAREGARVIALDIAVTMILRTAAIAALNGLHHRVVPRLGPTLELAALLDRLAQSDPSLTPVDAICALGLIYHFDHLVENLEAMASLRVPMLLEFNATPAAGEATFDPARHRNPLPVSLPWLTGWLEARGFEVIPEPAWPATVTALETRAIPLRQEMLLALPVGR